MISARRVSTDSQSTDDLHVSIDLLIQSQTTTEHIESSGSLSPHGVVALAISRIGLSIRHIGVNGIALLQSEQ